MDQTRRQFLNSATAGAAAAGLSVSSPFIARSYAQAKKTVVLASMGPVTGNWDPTSHTTLGQLSFESFVFSHLTRCPMEEGKVNEILPDLATSWKLVDPNTLEFVLRKGVKFHDGKEFGAEDVKATMQYASQPSRPAAAWYPGPVDVEIVDPHTVHLHTEKYGYPASAYWFVASFLPMMSAKDVADPKILEKRPNGTGPFKYIETDGDKNIIRANDDYHGGRPKIDEVVYAYVPDSNTRVLGLLNGQYQIIERLEPEQYESLAKNQNVVVHRGLSTENKYLHFRCNKKPFDDVRIRQAACHAIDRQQILALMGDAARASSCYVSPMKWGFMDIPGYPEFNPELSQKLLAEAGFPGGKGLPQLEYITSIGFYAKTKEYGELITAMLGEQGFDVKLSVLEPAAWEQAIYRRADGQGPGHMCDVGWITGSPEPDLVLRPNWYSKAALICGVNDPEIDAVLDKERNASTPEERLKILQTETFPTIAKKVPSFSLFSAVNFHGMAKNLKGVYFFPNGPIDLAKAELTGRRRRRAGPQRAGSAPGARIMIFALDFFLRRLSQGIVIVLLVALLIFTLLRVVPGDPVRIMLGPMTAPSVMEATARKLGLRDPILVQFGRYLLQIAHGDLGHSFIRSAQGGSTGGSRGGNTFDTENRAPVGELIRSTVPYSLLLAGLGVLFSLIIAVPIGLAAGLNSSRWPYRVALYLSSVLVSLPNVWLGVVFILIFSARTGWLPAIGYQGPSYAILPALVLAVELAPVMIRAISVSVAANLLENYVAVGQVRGLSRYRMITWHVLRNASIPLLNLLGVQIVGILLGSLFVVEYIFNYPGIGLLMINAVFQRDFPIIQAVAILSCVVLVCINILVDFAATNIDRRLQY